MKKYIILIFIFIISCVNDEFEIKDINNISILEFSSEKALNEIIKTKNLIILREILYISIDVSLNNILNHNTTSTDVKEMPYKYQYIFINDSLEWEVLKKEIYKYVYDPLHPDSIQTGEMMGFVIYPDINIINEQENINKILDILFNINK